MILYSLRPFGWPTVLNYVVATWNAAMLMSEDLAEAMIAAKEEAGAQNSGD